ncbi:uncharacterized protein BT62DRAFT_383928 [Guyanagaster necrorhizus]|uniref:Apple domain-containing protein n=1 Tax=Guyanagaster necrorhizus TaxID=856835 RepID=A0A9P8AP58_9AGAR|nr:uncharacterized protein BT62DRAFT_383928 [Guyanagaster necrorhizus MCA 3950]KAG7442461.1 hypothetical protein BT62DRAFT_383928 [Guyanagaster necrorhizus MCA 3950]
MRFLSTFFATVAVVLTVHGASLDDRTDVETVASLSAKINKGNCYGAPVPPWDAGCSPGWYYGDHHPSSSLICLKDVVICGLLSLLDCGFYCPNTGRHTEAPKNGYKEVFTGYTAAVRSVVPGDYLTYGLVDTVQECMDMCNTVVGCQFINTYHDVHGKVCALR